MIEVLWHGRGGQGAFTAARLLGAASSFADGRYALAFPSFGPERRGAPMRAFTKMADEPIGDRSAVSQADYVVYLDDTLFGDGWESELKPGGVAVVNTTRAFNDSRIVAIDANGISQAELGRPIPNTALLGALCAVCDRVSADDVKAAIEGYMPRKLHDANKRVVDVAAAAVLAARRDGGDVAQTDVSRETEGSASCVASAKHAVDQPVSRDGAIVPTLKDDVLDPADFARTTCFVGGYLVAKNAGWRNKRPVVDAEKCTGCLQCYLYCPDGTIVRRACRPVDGVDAARAAGTSSCGSSSSSRAEARVVGASPQSEAPAARSLTSLGEPMSGSPIAIDYDFCKGCGVCVSVCRFGALAMVPESEVTA